MLELPTGTVTFLFTDVEGSARLWEHDPAQMRLATARHDAIVEENVERLGGIVVRPRGEGDSRFVVFARASDAVAAAVAVQRALYAEPWPTSEPLRVRMAIHTGEADLRAADYYGTAVNRCARLRAIAHGGQILVSQVTYTLVRAAPLAGTTFVDLGEHRLRTLASPEHVYQLVAPGLPGAFPPLVSPDARPNNLPVPPTPLVGRERELAALGAMLAPTSPVRLLTLTGPGGIGKTRLATQLAADVAPAFGDGVTFVPLGSVGDPQLVVPAIVQALSLPEAGAENLQDRLVQWLKDKTLLLVLDSFEHLVRAATNVAHLLAVAPGLRVVVTSRAVLHLRGEREFAVPPLEVPDLRRLALAGVDLVTALGQYDAIRLFVERARDVRPDFELTDENAPRLPRSAPGSTGSRWRSSSPRPAFACCHPVRSWHDWTVASRY